MFVVQGVFVSLDHLTGGDRKASISADEPTVLRVGMLQAASNLNPFNAYEDADYVVFGLIYDRLIMYDEDLKPQPLIATSWESDRWPEADDPATTVDEGANMLWRYNIVQGARWHDGEMLTTEDVAFSINVNLNESTWAFSPYINFRTAEFARAINDTTVEVYLKIPSVHVAGLVIPIVPLHIWGQYTAGEIKSGVLNDFPIGSGPFQFVQFEKDQFVVLERNSKYFLGPVAYDRIVFVFYGSDQVMAEALKNGDIDVAKFPPLTYDSLKSATGVFTAAVDRYYQSTLGFNCWTSGSSQGNPLLRDENIRRAMHMAIDKQYIIDTIWRGYADIGYALPAPVVPEFFWQPNQTEALNYDVARANQLLNASGYDKWDNNGVRLVNRSDNPYALLGSPLSFKFMIRNDNPEDLAAAPYIKEMWAEVGVKANIQPIDESAMETEVYYAAAHEAYIWYWSGDMDPTYILGVMTEDQFKGWNDPYWSNATYDRLYLEQMSQDGAQRVATVFEMERIWYESSGMIVLSYPYGLYAWTEQHFTGWGDPTTHPGRTIDIYFGAPALYMELKPVSGGGVGGISSSVLIGAGVAVAAIGAAVVAMVLMKKRKAGGAAEGAPQKEEKKTGLE
ncbi:MAG: ABC transporter substrate-binding protein [Candidatus Thermoplasmatota archaeon]|nr:ABC transporter substrate-binding protein [Candidatus Thermoplasmatota archaeon]